MRKVEFTQEQFNKAVRLYNEEKKSLTKVGEIMGVSKTVITRIFKENNIPIATSNHKYKADYRKFQYIDSSEKAYWLGFIAADGCVYQRQSGKSNSLLINLSRKDKGHLEAFKKFMNSNVNIIDHVQNEGFSNNSEMSKIVFNSNKLVDDLIDKGVTPRKSLTLQPPKIETKYFLPFILGFFDGDGSISYNSSEGIYSISIQGTKELLNWINNILHISQSLEKRRNDDRNSFYIRCGGTNKPYQIMKQLYNSCVVNLPRKYQKFLELEKVVLSRNTKR